MAALASSSSSILEDVPRAHVGGGGGVDQPQVSTLVQGRLSEEKKRGSSVVLLSPSQPPYLLPSLSPPMLGDRSNLERVSQPLPFECAWTKLADCTELYRTALHCTALQKRVFLASSVSNQ